MIDIVVPAVGESVSSGIISTWLKSNGDYVAEGDDLFELETDKATMPIPATQSGVLTITADAGEEVQVGQVVAQLDPSAKGSAGGGGDGAAPAEGAKPSPESPESAAPVTANPSSSESAAQSDRGLSPAVRRLIDEHGISVADINGSGREGRITKGDVLEHIERKPSQSTASAAPSVQQTEQQPPKAPVQTAAPVPLARATVAPQQGERQTRVPMSNLRKRIAANLLHSKQNSAHLTTFNEVDMGQVMALRAQYKEDFEKKHGVRLGFMGFFIKAVQHALVAYPAVNAFLEGTEIVYNNFYNIGVAISTDVGLVVPVLRDVDSMRIADIEASIADFGKRARDRRLLPDEFAGGTFTVSNGGVFGSMLSTPIPNPPQTAILGMHTIQKRAVVVDDAIVIRPIMYLAVSYDHQVIDGREAIGFLSSIKNAVQNPERMLLDL